MFAPLKFVLAAKRSLQRQNADFRWQIFAFKLNGNCLCIGQTSGFYEHITNFSSHTDQLELLSNVTLNSPQYASIKHLYVIRFELQLVHIECIKPILLQLEVVRVLECRFEGGFYESFLKFCINLKELHLENIDFERPEFQNNTAQNYWLQQKYPSLEHFKFTPKTGDKIVELKEFFQRNINLKMFTVNSYCLFENWMSLIDTKANLNVLAVDFNCWPRIYIDSICDLLNLLQKRGFYKKLHLNVPNLQNVPSHHGFVPLKALEKLHIKRLNHVGNLLLFVKVNELIVSDVSKGVEMEAFARKFADLKRIYLKVATSDDIIAFIRHSTHLQEIHVENLRHGSHFYGRILDVSYLNKEREKLDKAHNVKIYVNKKVVNASKDGNEFGCVKLEKIDLNAFYQKFEF